MNLGEDILEFISDEMDPEDLLDDLLGELKLRNYSVTRVNNIDYIFQRESTPPGSLNFSYYKIVEFCNLEGCSRIISADMLSGVFMPARFLVFRKKGSSECVLAYLKPTAFAKLFDSSELMALARTLEEEMQQISEETIG